MINHSNLLWIVHSLLTSDTSIHAHFRFRTSCVYEKFALLCTKNYEVFLMCFNLESKLAGKKKRKHLTKILSN